MKLKNAELIMIKGGASATYLNAIVRAFTVIIDFGRQIGSSLRRAITKNYC